VHTHTCWQTCVLRLYLGNGNKHMFEQYGCPGMGFNDVCVRACVCVRDPPMSSFLLLCYWQIKEEAYAHSFAIPLWKKRVEWEREGKGKGARVRERERERVIAFQRLICHPILPFVLSSAVLCCSGSSVCVCLLVCTCIGSVAGVALSLAPSLSLFPSLASRSVVVG